MNITLIISGIIGFSSCEKRNSGDTGKGKVEFSFNLLSEIDQVKSGHVNDSGIISYHLLVSVEDLNGNLVLSDSLIPLYTFGTGYVSEDVELKAGEYRLTKFMVINPAGKVVYAAPVAGSPLAYLVNRPLPFSFNIYPNEVTKILPEVLAVGDHSPDQFGYASFGMQIIKPLIFWTICILNDSLVLSPTQITQANLTVYADSIDWHYTFGLEAAVNRLVIRAGSETYTFMLEKEGYLSQTMQFSAKDLLATSKEYPLVLKIPWDSIAVVTDVEGNLYNIVNIGSQVWMAENLKTTKYNDGTEIPLVTDGTEWTNLAAPGYCWYDNDISNKSTYGALYNWWALNTKKLCPAGWHVPTDEDWVTLEVYLGIPTSEVTAVYGWRGDDEGGMLKETGTIHWTSPNTDATNSTQFTALPGGVRNEDGSYSSINTHGTWWCSTELSTDYGWYRTLHYTHSDIDRGHHEKNRGSSIRCVKD